MLDPVTYRALSSEVWSRWAASAIVFPAVGEECDIRNEIIGEAFKHAPQDILASLNILIGLALQTEDGRAVSDELSKLVKCWDKSSKLSEALLLFLQNSNLRPQHIGALLAELLARRVPGAVEFAQECLQVFVSKEGRQRTITQVICRELIASWRQAEFQLAWPAIIADDAFGAEVFLDLAKQPMRDGIRDSSGLSDEQLANMFVWLESHFPRVGDPDHSGEAYYMGPRETLAEMRDGCLTTLVSRGSIESVEQLKRVRELMPHLKWIYIHVLNAEVNMMRATWTPPSPADILALARNSKARLVNNARELLEAISECFYQLQDLDLKGETPRAPFMWNENRGGEGSKNKSFTPKDEVRISDYVKKFLEDHFKSRAIIVNREVEVSGPRGLGRTDIHIDALIRENKGGQFESIKAVIELKGC